MNIKAIRNLRALRKAEKFMPALSRNQIWISAVPAIVLVSSYILFLLGMLSETIFIAQSTISMTVIIFVLYSNQLARFKMGTLELEMNDRSSESERNIAASKMER
jgi:hypothetical protein